MSWFAAGCSQLLAASNNTACNLCITRIADNQAFVEETVADVRTQEQDGEAHCAAFDCLQHAAKSGLLDDKELAERTDKLKNDVRGAAHGNWIQKFMSHTIFYFMLSWLTTPQEPASGASTDAQSDDASTTSNLAFAVAVAVFVMGCVDVYCCILHPTASMWNVGNTWSATFMTGIHVMTHGLFILWEQLLGWVTSLCVYLAQCEINMWNPIALCIVFLGTLLKSVLNIIMIANTLRKLKWIELNVVDAKNDKMIWQNSYFRQKTQIELMTRMFDILQTEKAGNKLWASLQRPKFLRHVQGLKNDVLLRILNKHCPCPAEEKTGWSYFIIGSNFLLSFVLMCLLWHKTYETERGNEQLTLLQFSFTGEHSEGNCAPFASSENADCRQYWRELNRFAWSEYWLYSLFNCSTKCVEQVCANHKLCWKGIGIANIYFPLLFWYMVQRFLNRQNR